MINTHYQSLENHYLFAEIARQRGACQAAHPDAKILSMGIGDVTMPLSPAVTDALQKASLEMGTPDGFHGYGPEQGYPFLREAIGDYYAAKGVSVQPQEIFVSDGAKSDLGNFPELFDEDCTVLIPDPVYPAYVDVNRMAGRTIQFVSGTRENGFLPMPPKNLSCQLIYLCSPNNPTGAVYTRQQLRAWVEYALAQKAVILFDAAYEAFVQDTDLPSSIYEIPNARYCAVEFCSFSKTAGFTGLRCGYTVVPMELEREGASLWKMWLRRQTTKYNGVPYVVQRAAQAVFSPAGQSACQENIAYYLENSRLIGEALSRMGLWHTGGINSPYVWAACPKGIDSWGFFHTLLQKAQVVVTPGAGFGSAGEGYVRFSAFGKREDVLCAMARLVQALS